MGIDFTYIIENKKDPNEISFEKDKIPVIDFTYITKEEEFPKKEKALEEERPMGFYGPAAPEYELREKAKEEPTREALPPMPYLQAYPAGLIEAGRKASKLLPPLNWYIEKSLKELPTGYEKKLMDHPIAKQVGGAFGEAGKYGALMLGGQAAGLFKWGAQYAGTLTGAGMAPKLAAFISAGATGGLIHATSTALSNLSDVMVGTKEPDAQTLLWEPVGAGAFGQALWGGQVLSSPLAAMGFGGMAFGARTAAPYIEKLWKSENPDWKALASDMAFSIPLGMFVGYHGYKQTSDAFMNATKNYLIEQNADFIQANANIINKNPESFIFTTEYKGQKIQWGMEEKMQEFIKAGHRDLNIRKNAIDLSIMVVNRFFEHPSPQIMGDFSNLSNIIKNSPNLIEGMTKDIQGGISPTVALMKQATQSVIDNPSLYTNEAEIARNIVNQTLEAEKNINNINWNKIVPAWTKEIKPEFQQLINSSRTLWETNNSLLKKYKQAAFVSKGDQKEEFENRIKELEVENENIKERLKDYGFQPATSKQKDLAHKLVNKSGMSDKDFLALKQDITGSDSMVTMSRGQANAVINALSFGPSKTNIPIGNEPVFKKPTLAQWPTSKYTYAKVLGLGPIMNDLFMAEVNRSLEYEDIVKFANDTSGQLKKQASLGDRLASKIKAQPTKPEQWMSELLTTYEKPEDIPNIDFKNKEIFKKIRDLTVNMLSRENAVRDILGEKPIENVKAYLPRVFDQAVKAVLNEIGTISTEKDPLMITKDLDVPDDVKNWLKTRMPRKPFNPTEFKRKYENELKQYYSKDLNKLIKWLGYYATREIHLSEPLEIFKGQLEHYANLGILPEETKDWAEAVVKYDIFKHQSNFEKAINNTFEPVTDLINGVLHPMNRHLSDPMSDLSKTSRKLVLTTALAGRPKMPTRNVFQRGLLLNMYPAKHFIKAQLGLGNIPDNVKKELRETWIYRTSAQFEDAADIKNKLIQWGMTPYRLSHAGLWLGRFPISNVDVALVTGWLAGEELRTSPRYIKWAEKKAIKDGKPKDAYKRTPQDSIDEAMRAVEYTQFIYHPLFMPQYFRGQVGRFFGSLTSWDKFFMFTHNRELLHVLAKGESYNGKPYPPYYRSRAILGYGTLYLILEGLRQSTGLDYTQFYFGGSMAMINPMARFTLGAIMYGTSKSTYDRNYGKYLMTSSAKLFTGFGLAGEEWRKWMTGKISTKEFFTFTEKRRR